MHFFIFDRNKSGEILSRVTNDLDKITETLQTGFLKLTGIVEEYYTGRNIIRAYTHEEESIQQVFESTDKNRLASQKADFMTNSVNPLIRLITRLGQAGIAVIAGAAMLKGTMTVGMVQAFFQYVNQAGEPLTQASFMINTGSAGYSAAGSSGAGRGNHYL